MWSLFNRFSLSCVSVLIIKGILAYGRTKGYFYAYYVTKTLTAMVCEGTMMTLSLAYVVLLLPTYTTYTTYQAAAVCPSPSDRRVQVCPPGSSLPRRPTGCRRRGARRPSASSPASAAPASSAAPWQPASSPSHPRFRSVRPSDMHLSMMLMVQFIPIDRASSQVTGIALLCRSQRWQPSRRPYT